MKKIFYSKLNKPCFSLAPMAGVADSAFRQICKSFGADLLYSEMASVTALVYAPEKTLELVEFDKSEQPYVVQLFGSKPDHFAEATKIITKKIKPDGIDINLGCPVPKVQKQGAGAILMKDMKTAKACIRAVIDNTDLPVSIKTRTQVGDVKILDFLEYIKDLDIAALMIHGRTLKQGFSGPIDTRVIKKARNHFQGLIFANGGINSYEDAVRILEETGADGLGVARGALGKPWIFKAVHTGQDVERDFSAVRKIALKHAKLAYKLKGEQGVIEMRKHLCWYVAGIPGAKELRAQLVTVKTIKDIENIFKSMK